MPRPPRPKPEPKGPRSRADAQPPPPSFRLSWLRQHRLTEVQRDFHQWYCELCRTTVLVPFPISSRALDAYLFEHRQRGCGQDPADRDEAGHDQTRQYESA